MLDVVRKVMDFGECSDNPDKHEMDNVPLLMVFKCVYIFAKIELLASPCTTKRPMNKEKE